jgi:hypothetical protein
MMQGWLGEFPEIRARMHNLGDGMEAGIKQLQQLVSYGLQIGIKCAHSMLPDGGAASACNSDSIRMMNFSPPAHCTQVGGV